MQTHVPCSAAPCLRPTDLLLAEVCGQGAGVLCLGTRARRGQSSRVTRRHTPAAARLYKSASVVQAPRYCSQYVYVHFLVLNNVKSGQSYQR